MTERMSVDELRSARATGVRPAAPDADLRGANLYGADLRGANLYGADLDALEAVDRIPAWNDSEVAMRLSAVDAIDALRGA